jgi:hypothetical protein
MSIRENVVASTHYGDFRGTVSFDRSDTGGGDLLWKLFHRVKGPKGYIPVGFGVSAGATGRGPLEHWHLCVYSVDERLLDPASRDGLYDLGRHNETIPVARTLAKIEAAELAELLVKSFKEFEFVAADRRIADRTMATGPD